MIANIQQLRLNQWNATMSNYIQAVGHQICCNILVNGVAFSNSPVDGVVVQSAERNRKGCCLSQTKLGRQSSPKNAPSSHQLSKGVLNPDAKLGLIEVEVILASKRDVPEWCYKVLAVHVAMRCLCTSKVLAQGSLCS
jgi:hypothetical protein